MMPTIPANRFRLGLVWGLAALGVIVGLIIDQAGFRMEGAGIAILCLGPLFIGLDRKLFPGLIVGPITLVYLYHFLGYAVGPLWQIYILGSLDVVEEGFVPAQWGGVLGLATFALIFPKFFQYALSKKLKNRADLEDTVTSDYGWHSYGLLLLLFAFAFISYGFATGSTNRLGGKETSLITMYVAGGVVLVHQVMFFFLAYSAAKRRGMWMALWILVSAGYALFFFLDGGRGTVMTAVILSGVGFAWGGVSSRKVLLGWAIISLIFIPVSSLVFIYRSYYKPIGPTNLIERFSDLNKAMAEFGKQIFSVTGSTDIFMRNITATSVDQVFLLVPKEMPFVGLEGIEKIPFAFVPEIIWPNRPVLLDGNELAVRYEAALAESSGAYMPAVGDGYRRGGWLGVVLIYIFSAGIYAWWLALCWAYRKQQEWMAMLIFIMTQSPGVWSTTLLANSYITLWMFPKYCLFFLFLRWIQKFLLKGVTGKRH